MGNVTQRYKALQDGMETNQVNQVMKGKDPSRKT
jgi:hypothetical protein